MSAWKLHITTSDGNEVADGDPFFLTSDDAIGAGAVILGFEGQDTCNDIGIARLTVPAEDGVNDYLVQDYIVHFYVRETYVTSYIIGVPQVTVVDAGEEAKAVAVYELKHLLGVAEWGFVDPAGGFGRQPASQDRILDSSDPARDNSDFSPCAVLGSVTDAQTNYVVVPYGIGGDGLQMEAPDTTQVIGPAGYGWTDAAPGGDHFTFINHDFGGGTYRVNAVGDNALELRVDGVTIMPWTTGFGNATRIAKFDISAGVHRVWGRVTNFEPAPVNPVTCAIEFVKVDTNDAPLEVELYTSSAWEWMTAPASPPGFTPGGLILTTLAEQQAAGAMTNVVCSFSATIDSDGNAWPSTYDQSTKTLNGLDQFWVKEITASLCDIDAHWDAVQIVIDAWVKDGHHPSSGVTITEGVNMGSLVVDQAPYTMSDAGIEWNDGGSVSYSEMTVTPPVDHPVKRRALQLGAARSAAQVGRDFTSQTSDFNRIREKPAIEHVTTDATPDEEMPGLAYWKWSQVDVSVTSRWVESGTLTLIAMTWKLDDNGNLVFTPEAGDLIVPSSVRAAVALRRLPGFLAGQSRVVAPFSAFESSGVQGR